MKIKRPVTAQEFHSGLQEFVGKDITKFYYITDSTVVLKAGKENLRSQEDKPIYDSEFEFWIGGGWKYMVNGEMVETSIANGEELPILRKRIGDFIESMHPKQVTSITVSDDGQTAEVDLDTGGKFVVKKNVCLFVYYLHRVYGEDGKFIKSKRLSPDSETGELTMTEVTVE